MSRGGPQVGQGTVAVVPTFVGFRAAVSKETDAAAKSGGDGFKRAFARTGQDSGKQVGAGFKAAFDQQSSGFSDKATRDLEANVTKATRTLSTARLKEQDLAGKVRVAEAQLAEARAKYASDSSQVIRAQERLESSTRQLKAAQDVTERSTDELRSAQNRLASAADNAGDQLQQAGSHGTEGFKRGFLGGLSGLKAAVVGVIAAVGLGQIIESAVRNARELIVGSIEVASDLSESINAVQVSYGDAARAVLELGAGSAKAFGLSKRELNSYATQFSSFVQTIAGPGGDIAATFSELVGRGSDFASVFNIEVADALATFQSGLAGESEPLRKYGIDLSAATVEAYAYSHGIAAAGSELSEAQKVQARYGALLEQTAKVQGDFANTSDQLANKNRINAATWDDIRAKIGEGFLPVAQSLATIIGDDLLPEIAKLAEEQGPALAEAFKEALPAFAEMAREVLPQMPGLFQAVAQALPGVIQLVEALVPILVLVSQNMSSQPALWSAFFGLLSGDESIASVTTSLTGLVGPLGDVFRGAYSMGEAFGGALNTVSTSADVLATVVRSKIDETVGVVASVPSRILSVFAGAGDWLVSSGRALIGGFVDGIRASIGAVGDAVNEVLSWAAGFFPHSPAKRGIFSGSGWTDLPKSGAALLEQWSSGFSNGERALFTSSSFTTISATTGVQTSSSVSGGQPAVAFYGDVHTQDVDELVDRIEKKKRAANYRTGATRKVG
ncbi:MAG: hypothetical protein J0I43_01970 [Microbacterium sp.]|uniref:hypothetical protein n=1 Tax=Microbacterium sp. TaxID=51671 RepID=UPI001AC12539|nr:hypothetical protein [Microbacterium sp.]MBN9176125.1 hypothetical protein [Microbacterium sp.]